MAEPRWQIPHRIETDRLVLRRYVREDAEQLAEVVPRNVPHLERFMEWTKHEPQTVEQRREFIDAENVKFDAGEGYTMGIFDLDGQLIGGTGFHVKDDPERLEIGYWIDQDHEGRGLVTEAAIALTRVALEFAQSPIVDISHAPENTRSAAIPQRLGYELQPIEGHDCHDSGQTVHAVTWWATTAVLTQEPLRSTSRPRLFDNTGASLTWPR